MNIRQVDGDDATVRAMLHWLQLQILPGDEPLGTGTGQWWVAYNDDSPIGFASLTVSRRWGNVGYLSRAGVLPAHRGKGVQRRLIQARVAFARRRGWAYLITDTYRNPASSNALIRCGFRMYQPRRPWSFDGACYWIKRLSNGEEQKAG